MKRSSFSTKMALFLTLFVVFGTVMMQAQNPTDVTGYETVSVSIPATSYDASAGAPQMAPVKYNKQFPLVITSDDMGKTELTNNWAELNGYPVLNNTVDLGIQPGGTEFLQAPLKKYYTQGLRQDVADYAPMTYTDNVGKTQRYRMTCAIMPSNLGSNNYSQIDANDAKLMLRTGFSYAQHDVEDISSVEAITAKFKTNSDKWAQQVGIGLKVMVEPNGNHNYLAAAKESDEICWSIFQNNTSEYPFNSLALTDWTHSRSDWTNAGIGTLPSNFTTKPTGGYARAFFQGNESAWQNTVNNADGTRILIGGTHGLGNTIKDFIRTNSNVKNNAWVAAADEVWEYYHIYNNLKIENVNWDGSNLTFDVQVPTYKKNQFRELTLNIPGLTGGTAPTFSTASGKAMPVTGGYNATGGAGIGYTMNLGMESSITTHIDELMTIYRDDQNNEFVKRDLEYLIAQLWDGTTKTTYTDLLNADPTYTYSIKANVNNETLYTGKTDDNETRQHAVPRYILSGTTLYQTEPNASKPYYVKSVLTSTATTTVPYTAKDLSSLAVTGTGALITPEAAFFVEGEDLDGVAVVGADYDINDNSARYWAMATSSGGMGGSVISGKPVTITSSLPRGKYKMVIGYGDSYKGQGTYTYTVNAGSTQVYSFNNSTATNQAVTEFTSGEFSIETGGTAITISSDYTSSTPEKSSRWIDYIYFVKTSSLDPIAPTAAITASAGTTGAVKINNAITITATATQNGGSNFTGTKIYRCSDSTGTIDGAAVATSANETATYSFTPTAAGTYYFKAVANDGTLGDGTSSVITITAVADIDTYTLKIIDKSGNEAITATVASASLTTDPLADQYRSPFAKNYHYYNTAAEAQANSGNALTQLSDFAQATIYVGYDVDTEKMGADKVHAIWANSRLMHMVLRLSNAHTYDTDYRLNCQKYDIADKGSSDITLHDNLVNTNYALLDNHYMWRLGTDPYNVVLQNVANSRYVRSTYNGNPSAEIAVANANTYCILYWQGNTSGSSVETSAVYCMLYDRTTSSSSDLVYNNTNNHYLACTTNDDYQWRSVDKSHSAFTDGSKFYISTMPEVTVNVLNSHGEVEAQIQAYNNTSATMPNYVPYSMTRAFTSGHALYYDAAHSDAVTMDGSAALNTDKLTANNNNLYLTYTIDTSHWRTVAEGRNANTVMAFDSESDNVKNWYAIGFNTSNYYIQASENTLPSATSNNNGISNLTGSNANTDTGKKGQWLLMGTPYNLQIVNRYHGDGSRLGIPSDATASSKPKVYATNSADAVTTWEVSTWLGNDNYFFFRPQGAFNAQAPNLYLAQEASISNRPTGGAKSAVYWAASEEVIDPSTVSLTAGSEAPYYVDSPITLTAVATPSPSGTDLVTSLIIEQETSPNVWETVTAAPAYAGSDVTGATKDPTTKAVTLTWQYIPAAAGTFNFRAHAVIDGNDQYSTDATNIGGSGSSLEIIASIRPFVVGSDNYTLILVDKSGNELYTESNVSASRVSELNSVSGRNGDPLNNDWRSPLVLRYNYYTTKADAQTNSGENLFDWTSTAATPTVYVGYQVSNDIDLNSSSFNSLSDLMTNRVNREGTDTKVRDASKFGKMYMLKFKMSEANKLEDGSDGVEATATAANTIVYPYTNGDGPMYIYTDARYQSQKDNGASTRTRWPWYLVSPTGDPYHVYVTSWQNSHANSDKTFNYYSYLRTYYNSTLEKVITSNITDDPSTKDGNNIQLMPTEYMILRGSGTDGLNYKFVTAEAISSGADNSVASLGKRQTVTSLEQYWRNNPTAQTTVGKEAKSGPLTSSEEATLTGMGWHKYDHYVNANGWSGEAKAYENIPHWFQTIQLGDGSLDIVETNIDGVLVLLDNHGWEVIRQPIVDPNDADYAAVQAALRKYDSPMVKEYKFYAARNVDHKVSGYHKYNINNDAAKCLTEKARVTTGSPITSLANYPRKYDSGALADLYVTYDVKDEYTNSYVGAATEDATAASQFVLRQGTKYAKADGATINAQATYDASDATYKWKLKPNFDIDGEMGYKYDVDIDGKNTDNADHGTFLDEATTNTNYYNNQRQGFDPYNLRIQNVSTGTYFTTNATAYSNYAYEATYPVEGMKVTLTDATATIDAAGYDNEMLHISNATFMAVQDANGNMRLMPRFDVEHVVDGFNTLAQQSAAQPANDNAHAQTTLLTTPITYYIIDNSGEDVFGELTHNGAGFAVAHEYQSPMVEKYYFHASLADATNSRTASTKTSFAAGDVVYVSYKATDDFLDASKAWIIYGNKYYMHAVYRTDQSSDNNSGGRLWWMLNQNKEKNNGTGTEFTIGTLPFLSNAFAWQVGENADPYNATFLNKGARRYMDQSTDGNSYQMGNLSFASETHTPFAILYQSASGDDCVLYNRMKNKYVYSSDYNNGDWRAGDDRNNTDYRLTITTLPEISINVVDAAGNVECSMEGYYKSGCTWSNSFTPFILERMYTSGHTFYYNKALTDVISGTVDDTKVLAKDSVFVKYTLDTSSWGVVDKTAQTLKVMPSPVNGKINWYAVKSAGQDKWFAASGITLPSNLVHTGSSTATSTDDSNDNKLAHWAFIGTPYNLNIVERYHGMFNYLGLSKNAVDGNFAFIDDGTADFTTWEVVTNVSGNTNIQLRPQRSLNGETPYLYLGWNGGANNMSMGASTGGNYAVNLTWVKETDAKSVTFKLYDSAGNAMSLNETALTAEVVGVPENVSWTTLFNTTDLPRQYCTYTFYTNGTFETATTADDGSGYDAYNNKDIYVKWNYTDDAPVFSSGNDDSKYQYYVFANRATNNGYTTYTPDGEYKLTGGEYNPTGDTKVGVNQYVDKKNSQWAFVGNPYNFALYNREGKYLKLADGATIANNANVDFTATAGDALSWCLPVVDWTDENQALSDRVNRVADAFRLIYPKINGYNVGLGNTRLNAGSDNIQWGFKRIEYIVVPLTVYDGSMTVKDEQEYSVPYPETDGHVINGDKLIRGTYHKPNLKHGFCDYTYYNTYTTGTPATLSGKMPAGGFDACGGTEQKKKEVYATYTVDEEMFLQPWLTYNITDGTKQHYSRINDSHVQESMQTEAATARQDTSKRYQWVFKGDPYNFQITNVSMGEKETTALYPLGAKETGWEISENRYLHVTNDTETYHYNTFEIVEAEQSGDDGSGKYSITLIHSGIDRYAGGIVYPKDGMMQMREDAYAHTWLTPVVEQYNIVWQVIDGSGSNVLSKTVKNQYDGKVIRPSDMPEELKRHFCDYTFYLAMDNAAYVEGSTPVLDDAGVAIHGAYTIYAKYTLDSGTPEFMSADPTSASSIDNKYWHEIHYPSSDRLIMRNASTTTVAHDDLNDTRTIATVRNDGTNYPKYCWALIGTPYGVKFYNRDAQQYLTTDGTTLSLSATGTTFDLMDDVTGDLCDIFDRTTETYVTSQATVSPEAYRFPSYQNTSAEFTNTDGLVKITFVLHYSDKTLRKYYSNNEDELGTNAKNTTQDIVITTFQKKGKALANVLPTMWKRAFCDYTYHWNNSNSPTVMANNEVTNINDDMVTVYNNGTTDIYVHVTYDFETNAPFKWSTADATWQNKYWYYLVNRHIRPGEEGRMIFRASDPHLLANDGLIDSKMYLSQYEWCVIGDPYGFKMLSHYDPDQRYKEYMSVTDVMDATGRGNMYKFDADNNQCLFEMLPGMDGYFVSHPIYSKTLMDEMILSSSETLTCMDQNYNGSAVVEKTGANRQDVLSNNFTNMRLAPLTTTTLAEYVKYQGFVGGLSNDVTIADDIKTRAANGTLTDEDKETLKNLVYVPTNITHMVQGYYRIVPHTLEGGGSHKYVQGYKDEAQLTNNAGGPAALAIEDQEAAEYDPATIFWFEGTTHNGTEEGYPRYLLQTQGLSLSGNGLTTGEAYKVRYEDLGAAVTQLRVSNNTDNEYLSCASEEGTSTNKCFDEHTHKVGETTIKQYKTRLYLQKVDDGNNEMPIKSKLVQGHTSTPILPGNERLLDLPYTYMSYCVPYDLQLVGGHDKDGNPLTADQCDMKPFIGLVEHHYSNKTETSDTYYDEDEYALYCESIDGHQKKAEWMNNNLYIPAGTPVIMRSLSGMTDVTFVIPTDAPSTADAANQLTENCLVGNYIKKSDSNAQIRVFGKESVRQNNVKFYTGRVGLFPRTNTSTKLPANSPYYVEPTRGASSAPVSGTRTMLMFGIDETTRISDATRLIDHGTGDWYDLGGRKLNGKPTQKGVYIYNGKKRVIK